MTEATKPSYLIYVNRERYGHLRVHTTHVHTPIAEVLETSKLGSRRHVTGPYEFNLGIYVQYTFSTSTNEHTRQYRNVNPTRGIAFRGISAKVFKSFRFRFYPETSNY